MPTTVTRHIRETPGGGEFGSLEAARADAVTQGEGDLVTDDTILEFVVHGHSTAYDTTRVDWTSADFTTSATNYILIAFGGEGDSYRLEVSSGQIMEFNAVHGQILGDGGIVLTQTRGGGTSSNANGLVLDGGGSTVEVVVERVRIHSTGSTTGSAIGLYSQGQGTISARNVVIHDFDDRGVSASNPSSTISLENCTVDGCDDGISEDGGTLNASNTRATNSGTTDWSGTLNSGSHNLSSDATAPGTSAQTNATVSYTDAANDDYSLQSGDDGINNGTDLSPDVTVDFEGTSRPQGAAYDIGAYEFVEAAAGASTLRRRRMGM